MGKEQPVQPAGVTTSALLLDNSAGPLELGTANLIPPLSVPDMTGDDTMRIPSVSPTRMQDVFGGDVSSSSDEDEKSKQG